MPIRYTSRIALKELEEQLGGLRLEVYCAIRAWDAIASGPGPSIEDLAHVTGRKESSISGRVNELHALGLITHGPAKINRSGKHALTYAAIQYREPTHATIDHRGQFYIDFQATA